MEIIRHVMVTLGVTQIVQLCRVQLQVTVDEKKRIEVFFA